MATISNSSWSKVNGRWTVTVTVNSEFNLHMEKSEPGDVDISIATGDATRFAPCSCFLHPAFVVDADFAGIVFPKKIKITCLYPAKSDTPPVCVITEK